MKGSGTLVGRLRKAGVYPALVYFFFYFITFFYIKMSLECKDVED